jgi:HSP20 family protein
MRKRFDIGPEPTNTEVLPMDVVRRGDQFVLYLDLPGVDPSSIDITVDKHVLLISAERHPRSAEGDTVVVAERSHGRISRRVVLGNEVASDRIAAEWQDGVLTLTVPLAHHAARRTIPVRSGAPAGRASHRTSSHTSTEGARQPAEASA